MSVKSEESIIKKIANSLQNTLIGRDQELSPMPASIINTLVSQNAEMLVNHYYSYLFEKTNNIPSLTVDKTTLINNFSDKDLIEDIYGRPSKLKILLGCKLKELNDAFDKLEVNFKDKISKLNDVKDINELNNKIDKIRVIINKNSHMKVLNYPIFSLEGNIEISRKEVKTEVKTSEEEVKTEDDKQKKNIREKIPYIYLAEYQINKNTPFKNTKNKLPIRSFIIKNENTEYFLMIINLQQYSVNKNNFLYNSNNQYEVEIIDNLIKFNVYIKKIGDKAPKIIDNPQLKGTYIESDCYYRFDEFSGKKSLKIELSRNKEKQLSNRDEVIIETYTTAGTKGNINFKNIDSSTKGIDFVMKQDLYDINQNTLLELKPIISIEDEESTGGKDEYDIEEIRKKVILSKSQSLTNIIKSDSDIIGIFENNGYLIEKARSDILRIIFYIKLILKNYEKNLMIPNYLGDIFIDGRNHRGKDIVIHPGISFKYNKINEKSKDAEDEKSKIDENKIKGSNINEGKYEMILKNNFFSGPKGKLPKYNTVLNYYDNFYSKKSDEKYFSFPYIITIDTNKSITTRVYDISSNEFKNPILEKKDSYNNLHLIQFKVECNPFNIKYRNNSFENAHFFKIEFITDSNIYSLIKKFIEKENKEKGNNEPGTLYSLQRFIEYYSPKEDDSSKEIKYPDFEIKFIITNKSDEDEKYTINPDCIIFDKTILDDVNNDIDYFVRVEANLKHINFNINDKDKLNLDKNCLEKYSNIETNSSPIEANKNVYLNHIDLNVHFIFKNYSNDSDDTKTTKSEDTKTTKSDNKKTTKYEFKVNDIRLVKNISNYFNFETEMFSNREFIERKTVNFIGSDVDGYKDNLGRTNIDTDNDKERKEIINNDGFYKTHNYYIIKNVPFLERIYFYEKFYKIIHKNYYDLISFINNLSIPSKVELLIQTQNTIENKYWKYKNVKNNEENKLNDIRLSFKLKVKRKPNYEGIFEEKELELKNIIIDEIKKYINNFNDRTFSLNKLLLYLHNKIISIDYIEIEKFNGKQLDEIQSIYYDNEEENIDYITYDKLIIKDKIIKNKIINNKKEFYYFTIEPDIDIEII